jgi:hypothetical protein
MRGLPEIKDLYAFIVVDKDNTEGVPGILVSLPPEFPAFPSPMTCYQDKALKRLREQAVELAKSTGHKITLYKFSNREKIEEFNP